ncbi:MAG TPA: dockerin type I domain-containing protein, partial [bacterium]|nr:dockerin type I domain-containing protein [bacterium]
ASFLAVADSTAVTALVNFAAAETNPSAIGAAASIVLPSLLLAGTEDCVTPPEDHQIPMYNALISDCKTLVTLTGASHCQYAGNNGTCVLGEIFAGCSAAIPLETQETRTLDLLLPWLDYTLRGNIAGWTEFMDTLTAGIGLGTLTYVQDCPMPATPTPTPTPTPVPTTAPTATPTPECLNTGDATLDGTLTAGDAQMIFNIVLGTITPTYEEACAADCNGDDTITSGDAQQTFFAVLGTGTCVDPL